MPISFGKAHDDDANKKRDETRKLAERRRKYKGHDVCGKQEGNNIR